VIQFFLIATMLLCAWMILRSPFHVVAKLSVILQLTIALELIMISNCLKSIVELIEERLE